MHACSPPRPAVIATGSPVRSTSLHGPRAARPASTKHSSSNPLEAIGGQLPLPLPVPDWSKPIILLLLVLALALAARASISARRAKRLETQRGLLLSDLHAMQSALVPEVPAELAAMGVSVAYRPADGVAAGGDFYDVFELDPGRVALILGDVCGHGREALDRAALTRYTIRAYLQAGLEPRAALELAGQALVDPSALHFATVLVGVYELERGPPHICQRRTPRTDRARTRRVRATRGLLLAAGRLGDPDGPPPEPASRFPRARRCASSRTDSRRRVASRSCWGRSGSRSCWPTSARAADASELVEAGHRRWPAPRRTTWPPASSCRRRRARPGARIEELELDRKALDGDGVARFLAGCAVSGPRQRSSSPAPRSCSRAMRRPCCASSSPASAHDASALAPGAPRSDSSRDPVWPRASRMPAPRPPAADRSARSVSGSALARSPPPVSPADPGYRPRPGSTSGPGLALPDGECLQAGVSRLAHGFFSL